MTIFFQDKQEPVRTRVVRSATFRVALLSSAALLMVGFSNQEGAYHLSVDTVESAPDAPLVTAAKTLAPPLVAPVILVPQRVKSYAQNDSLNAVLDGVDSRRWSSASWPSPDDLRERQQSLRSAIFRGVGFPDIQSHRTARQSSNANVLHDDSWNTMIAWRPRADQGQADEPIAYVRCMGLSPQAVARRADQFERLILGLAIEHDVSASLIKAVVTEESCFNNKALSPAGAQGLMQLMPDTADWLEVRDPHDPEDNLRAGVRYIAYLKEKFDSLDLVLAAYNAGPGNVRRYSGIPPFAETQAYVVSVQANYRRYAAATRLATQ